MGYINKGLFLLLIVFSPHFLAPEPRYTLVLPGAHHMYHRSSALPALSCQVRATAATTIRYGPQADRVLRCEDDTSDCLSEAGCGN